MSFMQSVVRYFRIRFTEGKSPPTIFKIKAEVSPNDLPIHALEAIGSRQKSFINEFIFYKLDTGEYEAWYDGNHLATWQQEKWMQFK